MIQRLVECLVPRETHYSQCTARQSDTSDLRPRQSRREKRPLVRTRARRVTLCRLAQVDRGSICPSAAARRSPWETETRLWKPSFCRSLQEGCDGTEACSRVAAADIVTAHTRFVARRCVYLQCVGLCRGRPEWLHLPGRSAD